MWRLMSKRAASSSFFLVGIVLAILFYSDQCSSPRVQSWPSPIYFARGYIPECGLDGFTPSPGEYIIDVYETPFTVRQVKGQIYNAINDGEWEDSQVLFEIRGLDKKGRIRQTHADRLGYFEIRNVSEGRYCFKATTNGWASVMGIIVVSRTADTNAIVTFRMRLGT